MKVLVFGAEGMLGASVMKEFPEAFGTTRREASAVRVRGGIDISREEDLRIAFDWAKPNVIINCAGIVKSECDRHELERVYAVNSSAPHKIARLASEVGCRVVHISTDCVFNGTRGARTESDETDATDLYGRSKTIGELLYYTHCVTLRTSFIGRDPVRKRGLLEWLLAQTGTVDGYARMMWSGLSAPELARVIKRVVAREDLCGLFHVSGPLISKADLLLELMRAYGMEDRPRWSDAVQIDRSLDSSKFQDATGYSPPTWAEMAKELACSS